MGKCFSFLATEYVYFNLKDAMLIRNNNVGSEDAQGLHARFADALRRCQGSLKTADKLAISKFSTVAELQADLRQKQQEQSDTFLHRLLAQAMPCLSVMGNLSGILVASLPGRSIPTALIWGVLHLAIKV